VVGLVVGLVEAWWLDLVLLERVGSGLALLLRSVVSFGEAKEQGRLPTRLSGLVLVSDLPPD